MHRLLTNLTVVALVAHVWLGCCWHHCHACGGEAARAGSAEMACGVGWHAQSAANSRCCSDQPGATRSHESSDCHRGRCVGAGYTSSGRTLTSESARPAVSETAAPAVARGTGTQSRLLARVAAVGRPSPRLRTHLLFQVLLI